VNGRDARLGRLEEQDVAQLHALADSELEAIAEPVTPATLAALRELTDEQLQEVARGRWPKRIPRPPSDGVPS